MTPRPKLRDDLVLIEQTFRGEQSFIVKDPVARKYFRFRLPEVLVMQALDGERTAAEAAAVLREDGLAVTPAAVDGFVHKLTRMGLCERSLAERSVLQLERLRAERRHRRASAAGRDLFRLRWSVGDPDRLLDRWLPRLRFFFSPAFLALSIALFAVYVLILALEWPELSRAVLALYTPSSWTPATLLVFWVTGIAIIVVHELGHAFTCKHFGGQVHEMGAMLIYFEPAFYCNVNDAWTFPERRARLWVTAAGAWIQLVLASLAAIVWWAAVPGTLVSQVALAAVIIGGVTTVFANLNPLIPLDGYYALSDVLEVPNLRQRAFAHLAWLVKRHVLRLDLPQPPADAQERRILVAYGALAACYILSIFLLVGALAFGWLRRGLGAVGILLFAGALWLLVRRPLGEWMRAVRTSLREHRRSWRTTALRRRVGLGLAAAGLVLLLVPRPITVTGRFVAAPLRTSRLAAADSAIVDRVWVHEGLQVAAGAPLVRLRDVALERQGLVSARLVDSLAVREAQDRARGDIPAARQRRAELQAEEARLAGLRDEIDRLTVRARIGGTVVTPRPEELVGRRLAAGEAIVVVSAQESLEVRIALTGAGATRVRPGQRVRLLSHADPASTIRAEIAAVAVTGTADSAGASAPTVEARVRLLAREGWRPGATGEASVTLEHATLLQSLWWGVRRRVRSDILL